MTEIENRTAGDLFCEGPRPSDLRKCSIQCPQKQCVLSPWSEWVNGTILTYINYVNFEITTGIFRANVPEHVRLQPVIRLGQLLSFLTIVILIEYNLKRAKERLIEP